MTTVNVHEAKTQLSRLLERVENGEEIVIARAGRPVAELRAYRRAEISFGTMRDDIQVGDAFSDETESEVAALFDGDLGPHQ